MPPLTVRFLLESVAAIGTAGSLIFYFLCALSLASFLRDRRRKLKQAPLPESRLPLIFGVSDPGDPAIEVVHKLQAKYPNLPIELIVCDRVLGANIKVSNLAQMLPSARHELLLVNDSDIRVPADYLRKVVTPLDDASVGLVTCLYRGVASPTIGSRLEALGIGTDFVPGVLSARFLEKGLHFGLGSTLAFRRRDLEAIGGFEALLEYLADDYELGHRIASNGKKIEISAATVTTFLPAYTMRQFFRHQLRWSRTIRDARRWGYAGLLFTFGLPWWGYAGLLFTFGLPWALATLLTARGAEWAWALLAMTFAVRLTVGSVAAIVVLNDDQFVRYVLLLPLRDLIAPFVWAASFMGNRIYWRGEVFDLQDGRLTIAPPPSAD